MAGTEVVTAQLSREHRKLLQDILKELKELKRINRPEPEPEPVDPPAGYRYWETSPPATWPPYDH